MDGKNPTNEKNPFLSRGCIESPKVYHKNDHVFQHRCCKLDAYDWLADINLSPAQKPFNFVEVRFKNSRKEFYRITDNTHYNIGDIIAVEGASGHDIGIVSLAGEVARLQMIKKKISQASEELKKVYRRARLTDIEKWVEAVSAERNALYRTRKIAKDLDLQMKLNDVEYQGDKTKAIFYYTAEERVDFRELIKSLAEEFKVRVEMRQIGVRQEASRLGGIGSCGRELCCSTWITSFHSVTTNSARTQQLSLNPQKLAGQCSKLKCCLNYEYDVYVDALKEFPKTEIVLKTKKGSATYQKTDVFKRLMWYSYNEDSDNILAIPIDKVKFIMEENKNNRMPEKLEDFAQIKEKKTDFESNINDEDLHRFDE